MNLTSLKKINIGPLVYTIKFTDSPKYDENEEPLSGYIDTDNLIIYVDKNLPSGKIHVILIHEVLHGMLIQSGLNLREEDDKLYEQIIESLSHSIYGLVKENKTLINYIQKDK